MKIAITGASGKTGYRITEEALKKGIKVKQIVRKNSKVKENLKNTETYRVSLDNKIALDKALENVDALIIATGARASLDLTGPAKVDALGIYKQLQSCKRVGIRPGGLKEIEQIKFENIAYTKEDRQFKGSIPRRLVAKCCIDSLTNKQSINKIIEVTSTSENKKISFKKAMQTI